MATYLYYIVEHSFVVRYDKESCLAERWEWDDSWTPFHDLWDLTMNGRQLQDEAVAAREHAELKAMYGGT